MTKMRFAVGLLLLGWAIPPTSAQIPDVHSNPPPCTGEHCLRQTPGATVHHHGGPSAQHSACPQGTVYDSRKGTCHVMPN